MILTTCAACAAPLAHDAPRCVRCKLRYCDATCRNDHWRRGHKQMCKKIHRGGNAEQYNADKKYKEAVAEAVEACADDTKGQTCYICTQALHWKTKEGLVRGCSCRGTAGFAHVSCLAEQAKILVAEGEENNLDPKMLCERWWRWERCSLCEQQYRGVVMCALGWAVWKTYLDRPEGHWTRRGAMRQLGSGLYEARHFEDALPVREAEISVLKRFGASRNSIHILAAQGNLACTYQSLGREKEALDMLREVYRGRLKANGEEDEQTLLVANNYAFSLLKLQRFKEAKKLLRKTIPVARRVLRDSHEITLAMRWCHASALYQRDGATLDEIREAVNTIEEIEPTARRVLGGTHQTAAGLARSLQESRAALVAREEPSGGA